MNLRLCVLVWQTMKRLTLAILIYAFLLFSLAQESTSAHKGASQGDIMAPKMASAQDDTEQDGAEEGDSDDGTSSQLVFSSSPERGNAQPLEGAALSGETYIFFDPTSSNFSGDTDDIEEIAFYLNDTQTLSPLQVESVAPFDFAGSDGQDAYPFNVDDLENRDNTVTAKVTLSSGDTQTLSATFTAEDVQETRKADYYVATDGSDEDGGSVDNPFGTIAKALSVVEAGERIQLREGVYKEYLNGTSFDIASGRPGAPITIESYPGEMAIIDGSETHWSDRKSPSYPALFRLEEIEWFVVQNLTFRNSAGRALHMEGNHNIIRDVLSYDSHSDGIYVTGNNNLLEGVVSHGNYSEQNGGESADGIKLVFGDSNIIRNCRTYNNSDDGTDIWQSTNTLVEFCSSYENGRGPTGDGHGFKLGSRNGSQSSNSRATIRYNVGYKNRTDNFYTNGGSGITLLQNTSWQAERNGFLFAASGQPNVAKNNISYDDASIEYNEESESSNNSWDLGIEDPEFISLNPDSPDFLRLEKNSPAINAGVDLGLPYAGPAPDLGALEYGQEAANSSATGDSGVDSNASEDN